MSNRKHAVKDKQLPELYALVDHLENLLDAYLLNQDRELLPQALRELAKRYDHDIMRE